MRIEMRKAWIWLCLLVLPGGLHADALEDYVARPDESYRWQQAEQRRVEAFTITRLELVSQTWRGNVWTHHLQVVRPAQVRNPGIAFLYITGDGDGAEQLEMLELMAERAGAVAAVVTNIPNQPLYDDRREDALFAYTLDQYLKTGDETWPLLFPMVKGAVRAMDAVQVFSRKQHGQAIEGFVVAGASKRGWTTWLTAAVDPRVRGIAPMVIDMLNVKAQTDWARRVYGGQSEKIHDYVDLGLVKRIDTEEMKRLRGWVDPYSYRARYTMPKLLLIGTNDPYWTVDSLRHYWDDLPQPKLIYQTPNAGHDLAGGRNASQSTAAFFQMIADGRELPRMEWQFENTGSGKTQLAVTVNRATRGMRLWTADSADRDLRNDTWTSRDLEVKPGSSKAWVVVTAPESGYRAYLVEAVLTSSTGHDFRLSTEARVTPDNIPGAAPN